jgi:hypothetical protein
LTHLAVALAVPVGDFLGYEIPGAARTLFLVLEDDAGEYQDKLRDVIGERKTDGRIRIITREDFYDAGVPIDAKEAAFQNAVRIWAGEHQADLLIIDNLAHVIDAEYTDPKRVHELMNLCYGLARDNNLAVIVAAHPRKDHDENPISLESSPLRFFESIMGTSHFINSTGSLWGLERQEQKDRSVFVGGRQRGDGNQEHTFIAMDDNGWFEVLPNQDANLPLVLNTGARKQAWNLLPEPPNTFGYREGESLVQPAMHSSSTYAAWIRQCRRLSVISDSPDKKLVKAVARR